MAIDAKILCLGALHKKDASGYELQKAFKDGPFGHFLEASYGSIYPALTKLTEEGLVTFSEFVQEGRPDKKVYSITPAGEQVLAEAVRADPVDDKFRSEFLFFMSFAELMEPGQIGKLIDQRIDAIHEAQQHLDDTEADLVTDAQRFVHGYGQAMVKASLAYLRDNRSLIENMERKSVEAAPSPLSVVNQS